MGKMPSSPSYDQMYNAQSNANYNQGQQNIAFGNANINSPYGSSTWDQSGWQPIYNQQGQQTGWSPRYTQNIKLSAGEEKLRQQNERIRQGMGSIAEAQTGRLGKTYAKDMNTSGLQDWTAAAAPDAVRRDEAPTDRAAVQAAMMRLYDEDSARQNAAQQNQMFSRGMAPGSQGYGDVMKSQADARTRALDTAFLQSGQESRAAQDAYNRAVQQDYAMGADWAGQLNNLRQNQFVERTALRDQPLKEAMTMAGYSGPNTPTFSPFQGTSISAVPAAQLMQNDYENRSQAAQNAMTGGWNLAGQIAGALPWASWLSDRRLKTDINRLPGRELAGVPLYAFTYKKHVVVPKRLWGTRHVGVMADEVREIHPDAVRRLDDGFDRVNYELLNERDSTWPKAAAA